MAEGITVTARDDWGEPSDEELAAIMAAVELVWPRDGGTAPAPVAVSRWRFSGRWWSKPVPVRRDRPN